MLPNPHNKFIKVQLHQFQVENAETDHQHERGEAEDLGDALAGTAAILAVGNLRLLSLLCLANRLVLMHNRLLLIIQHPLPMLLAHLPGYRLILT